LTARLVFSFKKQEAVFIDLETASFHLSDFMRNPSLFIGAFRAFPAAACSPGRKARSGQYREFLLLFYDIIG